MGNSPDVSSQSTPDKRGDQVAEHPSDNSLAENSQENLDARLDHAIEETFPTSDPVSVTSTKGPEPDQGATSSAADNQQGHSEQGSTEEVLQQVREGLQDVVYQASGAAGNLYNRGEHYARQAREQYPETGQYIRQSPRTVTKRVAGNHLIALLMAGVAGYAPAWPIQGQRRGRDEHIPDYGRTDRGYAPYRDEQRMR